MALSKRNIEENSKQRSPAAPPPVSAPLALLLFSQLTLFVGVGAVIPTLPLYAQSIGLSASLSGVVLSTPALALLLLARASGGYADRARKPAMLYGMALIAVSDLGTAVATGLPALLLARFGLGAGRCLSESGERGMLADMAARSPETRGRLLAAQQACAALGIAIGAPLGGLVVQEYGARASFLCVTAAAVAALIGYSFLPETVATESEAEAGAPPAEAGLAAWRSLLASPEWRGLVCAEVGAKFGFAAKIASVPLLAAAALGGPAAAGALLSAAALSGLVGAPLGGWFSDRYGARATAVTSGVLSGVGLLLVPVALALPSGAAEGAAGWVAGWATDLAAAGVPLDGAGLAFAALILIWSIGAAAQGPATTALAQELAPRGAEATALAMPRAFGDGAYVVAPALIGLVADSSTVTGAGCAAAGAVSLAGAVALAALAGNPADK